MAKETKKNKRPLIAPGAPDLASVDETFDSPQQMQRALDAFLAFLHETYGDEGSAEEVPNVLGFVVRTMRIRRETHIDDVEIYSDFFKGIVLVRVPAIENESEEDWGARRDKILSTYWPSLQDAQIRATIQLYKSMKHGGREWLEQNFLSSETSFAKAPGNDESTKKKGS